MRDVSGNYRLINKLGRGGMGQVWGGVRLGREDMIMPCAIKVLHPALAETEDNRQRFFNEARIAAQLDHGRIVKVTDTSEVHGSPCLVMEWVDGVNLREFVDKIGVQLELDVCLHVVGEVLAALEYAHERTVAGKDAGVIHYDVTPSNIMISSSGEVKLTDFGIARFAATVEGTMSRSIGTPRYMSPEQLSGRAKRETDIYSLGVVLHELLTGARFLDGCNRVRLQTLVLDGHVPELNRAGTPAWVDQLRRQMLANQPDDRPRAADARALILQKTTRYHLAGQQLRELYQRFVGERRSGLTELVNTKELSRARGNKRKYRGWTPPPLVFERTSPRPPPSQEPTEAAPGTSGGEQVPAAAATEMPAQSGPARPRPLGLIYGFGAAVLLLFGITIGLFVTPRSSRYETASPASALVDQRAAAAIVAEFDPPDLDGPGSKPPTSTARPEPDPAARPPIEPEPAVTSESESEPESEPEPKPKPKPRKVEVTFVISGVASAEIEVGSRPLRYNHVAITKLHPRKYKVRWRESKRHPWLEPGSLTIEELPKGSYYEVRLGPTSIATKKRAGGSAR
ncbi:Serine/threonine-protein kinase pkn6 [Enhygromyxa salina]|uniref:Serine/threonine-protein kinase pkn6 n=1 Tax=Enhygromyxa salina TaxID=215803 RepID=A0A2S9YFL2_9BACT|nr:serine/threonine-protein kinase [Enhygromyxa salina]PRQ03831.1 Serine/threonine-protein kinase pkn6 [Enhygromyxa salina]